MSAATNTTPNDECGPNVLWYKSASFRPYANAYTPMIRMTRHGIANGFASARGQALGRQRTKARSDHAERKQRQCDRNSKERRKLHAAAQQDDRRRDHQRARIVQSHAERI